MVATSLDGVGNAVKYLKQVTDILFESPQGA